MNTEAIQPEKRKRGRPTVDKEQQKVETIQNNIYNRDFVNKDGTTDRWYYNLNKYPRGPYKVECDIYNVEPVPTQKPGKTTEVLNQDELVNNMNVKKTKRLYINPNNGKVIGYTRARMLGLID